MELKSEYAFTLYVKLAELIDFGNTFNGDRRLIPIVGGHFEGPKLKGDILPGGKSPEGHEVRPIVLLPSQELKRKRPRIGTLCKHEQSFCESLRYVSNMNVLS
jgi:hypothetical protein